MDRKAYQKDYQRKYREERPELKKSDIERLNKWIEAHPDGHKRRCKFTYRAWEPIFEKLGMNECEHCGIDSDDTPIMCYRGEGAPRPAPSELKHWAPTKANQERMKKALEGAIPLCRKCMSKERNRRRFK